MEKSNSDTWCVYVLKCRNNYLYIGSTNNLKRRLREHERGVGSKFVRDRRPFELLRVISCKSRKEARRLEFRLKKLKRDRKVEVLDLNVEAVERRVLVREGDVYGIRHANQVLNQLSRTFKICYR